MFNEDTFNKNDLTPCLWQYEVYHHSPNNFKVGEKCFLKSNPEVSMVVHSKDENKIMCMWNDKNGEIQLCEFPPECLLQYELRVLLIYNNKYKICLD